MFDANVYHQVLFILSDFALGLGEHNFLIPTICWQRNKTVSYITAWVSFAKTLKILVIFRDLEVCWKPTSSRSLKEHPGWGSTSPQAFFTNTDIVTSSMLLWQPLDAPLAQTGWLHLLWFDFSERTRQSFIGSFATSSRHLLMKLIFFHNFVAVNRRRTNHTLNKLMFYAINMGLLIRYVLDLAASLVQYLTWTISITDTIILVLVSWQSSVELDTPLRPDRNS